MEPIRISSTQATQILAQKRKLNNTYQELENETIATMLNNARSKRLKAVQEKRIKDENDKKLLQKSVQYIQARIQEQRTKQHAKLIPKKKIEEMPTILEKEVNTDKDKEEHKTENENKDENQTNVQTTEKDENTINAVVIC